MANLSDLNFDAAQVEPARVFDVLPEGEYRVTILDSNRKVNSKRTGELLEFTFAIQDGPHAGRMLWANLNITHEKPHVQQMGRSQLSAICRAVGVLNLDDTKKLHFDEQGRPREMIVVVKIKQNAEGKDRNEIKKYKAVPKAAGASPGRPSSPAAAPSQRPVAPPPQQQQVAPWLMPQGVPPSDDIPF